MSDNSTFCPSCGAKVEEAVVGISQGQTGQVRASSIEIADKAKAASQDAIQSLKIFAVNPTGGLLPAYENLDRQRALAAGLAFALIFDLCLTFGIYRVTSSLQNSQDALFFLELLKVIPESQSAGPSLFKLLILGLVPFVSIAAALAAARAVFRGTGSFEGDVFIAGASLLPFGLFFLLSGVLGFANAEVIAALSLFALCYTILMIYTGCTRIARIPEAGAALAVPIILLLSGWLSKIILASMWSAGIGR